MYERWKLLAVLMHCLRQRPRYRLVVTFSDAVVFEERIVAMGSSFGTVSSLLNKIQSYAYHNKPPDSGAEGLNAPNISVVAWTKSMEQLVFVQINGMGVWPRESQEFSLVIKYSTSYGTSLSSISPDDWISSMRQMVSQ